MAATTPVQAPPRVDRPGPEPVRRSGAHVPERSYVVRPAPGAVPVLGHVWRLWRDPLAFLRSLAGQGDLLEIRIGPKRAYLAADPDVVRDLLQDPRTFDKGGPLFDTARRLTGNGLVTSRYADHRGQRRMLQPAFHAAQMPGYTDIMIEEFEAEAASWRSGEVVDVRQRMQALTLRIVTRTMFGELASEATIDGVQECLPVIMDGVYRRMVTPTRLAERLPTAHNRAYEQALTHMHEVIDRTIADYHARGRDEGDLLSLLVNTRDPETGAPLSDQEIHDQVMTMYLGGSETTANAMASAFHLISEAPDVEARLHAELDALPPGREALREAVGHLDYASRVTTEALRMRPPVWLATRTTTRPAELAGRRIEPGTILLYSPYLLHLDPATYEAPDRFDPDRWLPERTTRRQRTAFLPFGAGNRQCIGNGFSMIEVNVALATVASRWTLRLAPGASLSTTPAASLGPGPLPMTVQARPRRETAAPATAATAPAPAKAAPASAVPATAGPAMDAAGTARTARAGAAMAATGTAGTATAAAGTTATATVAAAKAAPVPVLAGTGTTAAGSEDVCPFQRTAAPGPDSVEVAR